MSEPRGSDELTWTPVQSSNIAAVAREGRSLYVRFLDGSVYRYAGAAADHDRIAHASSPGGVFYRHIKGLFPSERIE